MLRVSNLRKGYGDRAVIDGASFAIGPGDKVGLVGPNGSGKTTLLKILAGQLEPEAGSVNYAGNPSVAYLPQHPPVTAQETVGEFLAPEFYRCCLRMKAIEQTMQDRHWDTSLIAEYSSAVDRFEAAGGYVLESRLEAVLAGLSMHDIDLGRRALSLSGGQMTRAALARVLLKDADVLLLDEPTNNLDRAALDWLEESLLRSNAMYLIVSHDRRFLDRVTKRTLELDPITARITDYSGNYSWYRLRKSQELAQQMRAYKEQQDRIKRWTDDIRAVKNQAQATENSTVNDYLRGRSKKVAAKAKAREKRLNRLLESEKVEKPRHVERMRFTVEGRYQYTSMLIGLENVSCEIAGMQLFSGLNLDVRGSTRIVLAGDNGTGKSTLLKIIVGERAPTSGSIFKKADLRLCYFPQQQEALPEDDTVLDFFSRSVPDRRWPSESDLRTFLHRFQFTRDDVFKKIGQLSRGERTKLLFATFMVTNPDLLIMDEPTNHLDVPAIECLEEALSSFHGAFIIVSHDRHFVDAISPHVYWHLSDHSLSVELLG